MDKKKVKLAYLYKGITAFCVIAASVLLYFFIYRFDIVWGFVSKVVSVLQPVIFGLVISYLVNPIVNLLNSHLKPYFAKHAKNKVRAKKVANLISVIVALLVFVIIIFALIALVIPQFISSISNVITVLPGQIDVLADKSADFIKSNAKIENVFLKMLEYEKNWLQTDLAEYVNKLASNFANGIWSVLTFLKNFFVGLMFAIYLLLDKERHARRFRKLNYALFKESYVKKILHFIDRTLKVFSGFINGKLIDSLIIGLLCFIGVTALRIPYTMLVAVIVGVTNIIPVFGPYIGAIPCAALILLTSPIKGLYFIIFIILLQALDGNFIGPKILGDKTGLETFWVIFAIIVGGGMFGVLGMLIGVPAFALFYYFIRNILDNRLRKKNLPIGNEAYTGVLGEGESTPAESEEKPDA